MGKTELSLARFHLSNPHWNPDSHMGQRFLQGLKSQIDATALGQYTSYLATQLQPFDSTSTITAGVFHGQPQGQLLSQSVHSYMSMNPMVCIYADYIDIVVFLTPKDDVIGNRE